VVAGVHGEAADLAEKLVVGEFERPGRINAEKRWLVAGDR